MLKHFALFTASMCLALSLFAAAGCEPTSPPKTEEVVSDGSAKGESSTKDGGSPQESAATEKPKKVDLSHEIYDESRLLQIEIEIKEADWKALGAQKKDTTSLFVQSKGCPGPIPPSPYTYFPAKVTIDGKVFPKVGVRKKGLVGSQSSTRPSLKIKFHEYDADLRFKGEKRLTLNNNKQDPSRMKTCLAYRMFRRAKIPAPRCTFVKLTVNGKYLGVYSNVEPIKKPFLARHFTDNTGDLYEGSVGDFREKWRTHLEKKTNEDVKENPGVDKLIAALKAPDAKLLESLKPHLDVDQFVRFWAMEVLLGHFDGYNGNANNFYVYYHPVEKKFTFIPWGADATWNDIIHFQVPIVEGTPPQSVLAHSQLAGRLYALPATQDKYKKQLLGFVDELWDAKKLNEEVEQLQKFLAPHIQKENATRFEAAVKGLSRFIDGRAGVIRAEWKGATAPKWPFPQRTVPCTGLVGTINATLATTYSDTPVANPLTSGSGTFTATLDEKEHKASRVGGSAVGTGGAVSFTLAAIADSDAKILALLVNVPKSQIKQGNKVTIEGGQMAFVGRGAPGKIQLLGFLIGEMTFTEASLTPGGKIEAKLTLSVLRLGSGKPL